MSPDQYHALVRFVPRCCIRLRLLDALSARQHESTTFGPDCGEQVLVSSRSADQVESFLQGRNIDSEEVGGRPFSPQQHCVIFELRNCSKLLMAGL